MGKDDKKPKEKKAKCPPEPLAKFAKEDMVRVVQCGNVNTMEVLGTISQTVGAVADAADALAGDIDVDIDIDVDGDDGSEEEEEKGKGEPRQYNIYHSNKDKLLYIAEEQFKKKKKNKGKTTIGIYEPDDKKHKNPLALVVVSNRGANIEDGHGNCLGMIVKNNFEALGTDQLLVQNEKGETLYKLKSKMYALKKNPGSKHFYIKKPGDAKGAKDGRISRQWTLKNFFSASTDRYKVEFPKGVDSTLKTVIGLGAIVVDLMYFEEGSGLEITASITQSASSVLSIAGNVSSLTGGGGN